MLDYPTLKIIWWLLVGVLLVGFAIMDGHDMGGGTLLPFVGRSDTERRVVINTVGPHWDGNQVWFITGGGAIFAAWPLVNVLVHERRVRAWRGLCSACANLALAVFRLGLRWRFRAVHWIALGVAGCAAWA